jgi:hypothetical protein
MQSSHRPISIWARPTLAGLVALGLLASATVAVAAPRAPLLQPQAGVTAQPADLAPAAPGTAQRHAMTWPAVAAAEAPNPRSQVAAPVKTVVVAPKPKPAAPKPKVTSKRVTVTYHGVYHLWIPALGLSRGIYDWGCNGGLIPNRVEYWACAGKHNLYLLGHAWGVFAKIHDGYHSGALRVGLAAWYADKAGRVHRYRISVIRHVANADYATWSRWAMASSSSQIITLQTCDGATSAYRILVRLVPA